MGELLLIQIFFQNQWSQNAFIAKSHIGNPIPVADFHKNGLMGFCRIGNPIPRHPG